MPIIKYAQLTPRYPATYTLHPVLSTIWSAWSLNDDERCSTSQRLHHGFLETFGREILCRAPLATATAIFTVWCLIHALHPIIMLVLLFIYYVIFTQLLLISRHQICCSKFPHTHYLVGLISGLWLELGYGCEVMYREFNKTHNTVCESNCLFNMHKKKMFVQKYTRTNIKAMSVSVIGFAVEWAWFWFTTHKKYFAI